MPAASLDSLQNSLTKIADHQGQIRPDVHAIKEAIVGGDISETLKEISKKLDDAKKLAKGRGGVDLRKGSLRSSDRKISGKFEKDPMISKSLGIINQLKDIKLKDFLNAPIKFGILKRITKGSLKLFKKFKDQKEIEGTFGLVERSLDLTKNLTKIDASSKKAEKGIKSLERIFFGRGRKKKKGLVALFRELYVYRKEIKAGQKAMAGLATTAGSMLVMTLCLAGLAVSAVPAMVGTLAFVGLTWILSKTFRFLGAGNKHIVLGSIAIATLCAGLILFAVGIGKFAKAVKDLKLKDVGLMAASIGGVGLAVAGVGLLSIPILLGSATLVTTGAALGILALSLMVWRKFDATSAIGNVKIAVSGLKDALGLGKNNTDAKATRWDRFKNGLLGTALAFFDMGKTFAFMASILFAGVTLALVRFTLSKWENYDPSKAIGNMSKAIEGFRNMLGFNKETNNEKVDGQDLKQKSLNTVAGLIDFVSAVFNAGKTFAQLGSILFTSIVMGITKSVIEKWADDTDVETAIGNMGKALGSLKETLGLGKNEPEKVDAQSLGDQAKGALSDIIGFASSILQFGKTFFQMGAILLAVGIMGFVRKSLEDWKDYDSSDSIGNIKTTLASLKDALGLKDRDNNENLKDFGKNLLGGVGDILAFGAAILQFGKIFFQIGAIFLGVGMMNVVREKLEKWNGYDSSSAIESMSKTMTRLQEVLGLTRQVSKQAEGDAEETTEKKAKWYERIWEGVKGVGKKISTVVSGVTNGIKSMARLSAMVDFTSAMAEIKDYLSVYDNYNSDNAIGNIKKSVNGLLDAIKDGDGGIERSKAFKTSSDNIMKGLGFLKLGFMGADRITKSSTSIDNTVKSINALNMDKAVVMVDLFKSFAKIGNKPFNKFSDAVNKFVESCTELIDSMNKLRKSNEDDKSSEKAPVFTVDNTQDIANAIAEAIKSLPVNVNTNISDVRLVVNGESGRKVILTLDN